MFTPSAFKNITYNTYFVFGKYHFQVYIVFCCCLLTNFKGAFCAAMTLHVYFGFPETKGKRLEEIAQIWEEKVPAWKSKSWQPRVPLLTDQQMKEKLSIQHDEGGLITQSNDSTAEQSEKEQVDHVQDASKQQASV